LNIIEDPSLARLLAELHARSDAQIADLSAFTQRRESEGWAPTSEEVKRFVSDKLVALDRDKAEFCYQLCRAIDARRIVEIGTSHGVSTLYLAAALRDNIRERGGDGLVVGTEYEPQKAAAASVHFEQAGLSRYIELRQGDLRETLLAIEGPVDFLLVDIWIAMARPALELVAPHLRTGAVVICDNTDLHRGDYVDYFAFLNDPANGFQTMTLPFRGGLEMSVRRRS
jgi:predicted O-methyltransferase YrrM